MAGHSKWAQIKHKKAKMDQIRGRIFSKIAREIITAARLGGGDPEKNIRLRAAIEKAKSVNMPAENIERAIKKGTGELPGVTYEEVEYEGYGPGGVAIFVKTLTDNKNRTTGEIRHIFSKYGGNLGSSGCVAWQFKPKGVIMISAEKYDEDTILSIALEAGAEDVKKEGNSYEIRTLPEDFIRVKKAFEEKGIEVEHAELTMIPQSTVTVTGKEAEKLLKLLEALDELDEVQNVYANFDIPEEVMKTVSEAV